MVLNGRMRTNGHKLKVKKLHPNVRKNFFTSRVAEHWNKLPRRVVVAPSLETFQTCLGTFLCHLL